MSLSRFAASRQRWGHYWELHTAPAPRPTRSAHPWRHGTRHQGTMHQPSNSNSFAFIIQPYYANSVHHDCPSNKSIKDIWSIMIPHNYLTVINWYLLCSHLGWGSNFVSLLNMAEKETPNVSREYDMDPQSSQRHPVIPWTSSLPRAALRGTAELRQRIAWATAAGLQMAGPRMDSSDWLDWCSRVNISQYL